MTASKKRVSKIIFRSSIALILLAGIIGLYYLINIYGPELSGRLLKEIVQQQTDNKYEIEYESLDISALNQKISIDKLIFSPIDNDTSIRSYTISIPHLEVSVKSIFDIYWNKTLGFEQIFLTDPRIDISRTFADNQKTTLSIESGDLFKLIENSIFNLEIDSLGISNATVNYRSFREKEFHLLLKEIDFGVSQFRLDSANYKNKFLFTDNITLRLTNQQFVFGDSIHQVDVGSLDISTKSQNILFRDINLHPRNSSANNEYHVKIPELNFRGLDFKMAYHENRLKLDSIRVFNPEINIKRTTRKAGNKDLVPYLFDLFSSLDIGKTFIDNGKITYQHYFDGDEKHFTSADLDVSIDGLYIDSTFLEKPLQIEYFDQFKLVAESTDLFGMDSIRLLRVEHIEASSFDSAFQILNLDIDITNLDTLGSSLTINSPKIFFEGLDFRDLWLSQNLHATSILLMKPSIDGSIKSKLKSDGNPLINNYQIKNFNLTESKVNLDLQDQSIHIQKISTLLNEIHADRDSFNLGRFTDFWQTTSINLEDLKYANKSQQIEIKEIKIDTNFNQTKLYQVAQHKNSKTPIYIDTLAIEGLKMDSLTHSGFFIFDSLIVHGPRIIIDLDQNSSIPKNEIDQLIHKTFFQQVRLDRGKVDIYKNNRVISHMDSISTTLSSFHYDTIINEYFTGIDFQADTIHISFPDLHHGLSGSNISISQKDSTLDIHDLTFLPYTIDSIFNHYKIRSKELRLRQLNFHKLINEQEISFKSGFLQKPAIEIIIETPKTQKQGKPKDLISFESFNIGSGNIEFVNNLTGFSLNSSEFDVLIHDFDMLNDSNLFFAKNYLFDAKQTVIGVKKLEDSIRIGYSLVDTKSGNLSLKDIDYQHSDILDLSIPELKIRGLITEHLLDRGMFAMDSLQLTNPKIKYGVKTNPKKTGNPPNIQIANLSLKNGQVGIKNKDWNHGDTVHFNDLSLNIEEFIYDSLIRVEFSHHLFKNLDISGSSLDYTLPDSLFKVHLDRYAYDHNQKSVELSNFRLIPIYNRGEFQNQVKYQQDWFDGSVKKITMNGFEIDSLISNNLLRLKNLTIDELILDTHRDKRLPRESGVYKPLPQTQINKIPFRLAIDSIHVANSFVSHSEFSETGTLPGTLYFQQINADLLNFTNDQKYITANNHMLFKANGILMETGNFDLSVDFDLSAADDAFSLKGHVGDMNLTELNDFLSNTAFVQVRSGKSKMVDFYFDANNKYSIGEMTFYYDDLKITVLNQDSYDTKSFGASIKTFFANTFVVNTRNPYFIFVRDGNIFNERDQSKSIFNFWGKSLLSGVVSSIGAKNNKKEIKNQNDEVRQKYEDLKKSDKL